MHPTWANAERASAGPCGVSNAWESGSPVDRIRQGQRHGFNRHVRVPRVVQYSVYSIFPPLSSEEGELADVDLVLEFRYQSINTSLCCMTNVRSIVKKKSPWCRWLVFARHEAK